MINIILPIDFSEKTNQLVAGAIQFAKQIKGKISLIHVSPSDLGFAMGDMGGQYFPEIEENEIKQEVAQLKKITEEIKSQEIECDFTIKQGVAKDIILELGV